MSRLSRPESTAAEARASGVSCPPPMSRVPTYRDFYEYEADTYAIDAGHEAAWPHRRALVHPLVPRDAGRAILDVGCGDGALSRGLAQATGSRVTALGLSLRRVGRAVGNGGVRFAAGSSYELPFRDRSFSLVLCTDLLEHLDDPQRAMGELV